MGIELHITSVERVRYLLPLSDNELNGLMSLMARQIGLGEHALELSLLDDASMAELHFSTMGTLNTTNILSFPLLYGIFAPYVMVGSQDKICAGEFGPYGVRPIESALDEFAIGEFAIGEFAIGEFALGESALGESEIGEPAIEKPRQGKIGCNTPSQGQFVQGGATPMNTTSPPVPMLGSLVMAVETVQREAFLYGQELHAYTVFLLAHGFAHLLGYDHGTAMNALTERMERGALESLNATI